MYVHIYINKYIYTYIHIYVYTKGHDYKIKLDTTWWATIARSLWPTRLEGAIKPMWHEPCGDRQIEISIVVNHSNNFIRGEIYALFRRCLLNDEEFRMEQEL
jgi:hypothetical protein